MLRKLVIAAVLLALLAGVAAVAWQACGMPPLRLVLKYGYPSPMGPTGRTLTIEGVEFVEISPGYFRMGSHHLCDRGDLLGRMCAALGLPWGRQPMHRNECPAHWVELAGGFWIARCEVTNTQFELYESSHARSRFSPGDDHPVVAVSWVQAKRYCAWLGTRHGVQARLPSGSEWECACRAGSAHEYCFGNDHEELKVFAWYGENSQGRAHRVGTRQPNAFGLYDLHGNVREWCGGRRHWGYTGAPTDGSYWSEGGEEWQGGAPGDGLSSWPEGGLAAYAGTPVVVTRGGFWGDSAAFCRSASHTGGLPGIGSPVEGIRPAFSIRSGAEHEALDH